MGKNGIPIFPIFPHFPPNGIPIFPHFPPFSPNFPHFPAGGHRQLFFDATGHRPPATGGPSPLVNGGVCVQYFVTLSNFTEVGILIIGIFREDDVLQIRVFRAQGSRRSSLRFCGCSVRGPRSLRSARSAPLTTLATLHSPAPLARATKYATAKAPLDFGLVGPSP